MPTDIKLDVNSHDIDLSSGTIELHTDNKSVVAQRVKIAILTKQGEWFRNIRLGVPYYQEYFTSKNNKAFIDNSLINYITEIEDVNRVVSLESTVDVATRVLSVEVVVETSDGEIATVNLGA